MVARTRRRHGGLADAMLFNAVEDFLPVGGMGAVVGAILLRFPPMRLGCFLACGRCSSASGCSSASASAALDRLRRGLVFPRRRRDADPFEPDAWAVAMGDGDPVLRWPMLMAALLHFAQETRDAEA